MLVGGSALAMTLGFVPGMGMNRVEAETSTYNISTLEVDANGNIVVGSSENKTRLNMNKQREIEGKLIVNGDLEITGSNEFKSAGIQVNGNLDIKKDVNLVVNSVNDRDYGIVADGKITTEGNIDITSTGYALFAEDFQKDDTNDTTTDYSIDVKGGSINITGGFWGINSEADMVLSGGKITVDVEDYCIYSYGKADICGVVIDVTSENHGIVAVNDLNISDANIVTNVADDSIISRSGDVNITGGTIDANVSNSGCISTDKGSINISGGNIKANALHYAISSFKDINVTGGYVESNCSFSEMTSTTKNVTSLGEINISDDMYISEPENAKIGVEKRYYQTTKFITDEEGNIPDKVVIEKNPYDVDPDEDQQEDDKKEDQQDEQQDEKDEDKQDEKKDDSKKDEKKYSNEWVDGKWYNEDGSQTYKGTLSWKQNETGWWVEDSEGWFPTSQWQKIDGKWYFFCADGYMDYSEYREGCWLGADGAWDENFSGGHWMQDSKGWWYEDASGWYPQSEYVWIDGVNYWFGSDGYWA